MKKTPANYVIEVFGGVRKLARALNKTPSTISKWQKTGRVPSSSQEDILQKAEAMGLDVTAEDLIRGR